MRPQQRLFSEADSFAAGDIGYQDGSGYVYMLDRLKDMIVTGGENVYSGEVEAVISGHPAVREVAVFGIPDSRWGEIVAACVVLKRDRCAHCGSPDQLQPPEPRRRLRCPAT